MKTVNFHSIANLVVLNTNAYFCESTPRSHGKCRDEVDDSHLPYQSSLRNVISDILNRKCPVFPTGNGIHSNS